MIVNIQVRAFSSNKLQLFSYTILEDYLIIIIIIIIIIVVVVVVVVSIIIIII